MDSGELVPPNPYQFHGKGTAVGADYAGDIKESMIVTSSFGHHLVIVQWPAHNVHLQWPRGEWFPNNPMPIVVRRMFGFARMQFSPWKEDGLFSQQPYFNFRIICRVGR